MGKKILIVDDSRTSRLHLKVPMEQAGYEVMEAESGDHGIEVVSGHPEKIDLIISDYNMPDKTGVEMVAEIRSMSDNVNANADVIFLTSDSSPIVRQECTDVKAKAIVMKPIKPEALVKAVMKLIGQ